MRSIALTFVFAIPAFCADWNPRLAADYMDARQKAWFVWPRANASGAPCISCHTGLTYMLVRPELRRVLGEAGRTEFEQGFSRTMRARADKPRPENPTAIDGYAVDAVLSALLLATEDGAKLSAEAQKAFDRMWSTQSADGGWPWYSLNDDPWEMPESRFFGAALAAVAVGSAPPDYRAKPEVADHIGRLGRFLARDENQPLHNRIALLWAGSKVPDILQPGRRNMIVQQAKLVQQPDGGWTMASLGPWTPHPSAPVSEGSSGYATAFTAFVLEQAGVPASDQSLSRALAWLRSHQTQAGYWDAASMNHKYEAGSMMENFMRDAATGFASMALLHAAAPASDHPSNQ